MSINVAAKFNKPGLKTNLNHRNSLPKFEEKNTRTSASTGTSTPAVTGRTNNNSVKYSALSELENKTSRETIFNNGSTYATGTASTAARVGGKRNVNPGDYKMHNVDADLTASIENGFAKTSRGQRREARAVEDLYKLQAQLNARNAAGNGTSGFVSTMGMLNQLTSSIPQIVNGVKALKGSNSSSAAGNVVKDAASSALGGNQLSLSSLSNSSEVKTAIATENSKVEEFGTEIDNYKQAIKENTEIKDGKTQQVTDLGTEISDIKTQIRGLEVQKKRLAANPENAAQVAQLEAQIKELKAQQTQKESEKAQLETEIENLEKEIASDTENKSVSEKNKTAAEKNVADLTKKQEKLEKQEKSKLESQYKKLTDLALKASKETDETKKQKFMQEYKGIASTYNALVDVTTVQGFARVSSEMNFDDPMARMAENTKNLTFA